MAIDYGSSLSTVGQFPLNGKLQFKFISEIQDLGVNDSNVFKYYEDMVIHCIEDHNDYIWRERLGGELTIGLLTSDYTYPMGAIADDIDYSNRIFNFFEIKKASINTSELNNNGSDNTSTYVETDELGTVAFNNDYNSLDNLPTIINNSNTNDLVNNGDDGVNPFINITDVPIYQNGTNITIDNTDPLNPIINASGGGGSTNLTYTPASNQGTIVSDTGTDAIIPLVDATNAGLVKPDFYDENTFTPTLNDAGAGATYSIGGNICRYVRVGNTVTFTITLTSISTSGTPTGIFSIQGLPFTSNPSETVSAVSIASFRGSDLTSAQVDKIRALVSGDSITIGDITSASSYGSITLTGTSRIDISGTYITNVYTH